MHLSIYCFISFVTSGYQKFLVTNFTVFYCPLYLLTGVLWCNLIIFAFNFLSLDIYTFLFLYIMLSISLYSSSLSIFTPAYFISSTTWITSLFLTFDCLTFSSKSTLYMITSTPSVLLTFNYSSLTSISSLLSLSTPISQSGLLLKLSTFPILLPGTCLSIKSNLDRYRAYLACLLFNFYVFMKYSRFLWSIQISNFIITPSRKCLHASKHLTTTNIFLLCIS